MKGIRLVGAIATILLVLGSGIAFAEQDELGESAGEASLSAPPAAEPGPEIKADRTVNSRTFRLEEGGFETRVYADPINYHDQEDEWQPIGDALHEGADGAALTNGPNDFDVHLPEQIDSDAARISFGDDWISSQLLDSSTEAVQLEGKTATYESPQGNVTVAYSGLANGLKEDIEIAGPSQPSTFAFLLDASAGLSPELTEAGDIKFSDGEGDPVAMLPAPLMYDSAQDHPATSHAIHYDLEPTAESTWRLRVEADREWLAQPERVWPVHLDPSVIKLETSKNPETTFDCSFGGKKGSKIPATCGNSGVKSLTAAYWPKANAAEDEWSRVLLHFDLTKFSLPEDPYITSAKLGLRASEAALNTSGVELGLVKKSSKTDFLSWVNYNSGKPWSQEGGDYSEIVGQVTTAERGTAPGWWNFPLAVKPIAEFAYTTQPAEEGGEKEPRRIDLLAKLIDDKVRECTGGTCTQRMVKFESSAATLAENRPYLSLTYYPPAPQTSKLASPSDGTQSARRFKLKATWESGVTGVTFQYRKGGKGPFETVPGEFVKDAEGKSVSWPLAVSGVEETKPVYLDATALEPKFKAEEGKLQLRALFDGGAGFEGYSAPNSVTVNPDIGGPGDTTAEVGPGSVDLLTGNYTVSRSDFTLPGSIGGVNVSRTHNSRESGPSGDTTVLGRGWKSTSMIESAGGADWRRVREVPPTAEEAEEGLSGYAMLTDLTGAEIAFEKEGESYISPPEMATSTLVKGTGIFTLADSAGNKTVFSNNGSGTEYLPVSITQAGSGDNSAKYVYDLVNGKRRLKTLIAAGGVISCSGEGAKFAVGCHVLEFAYQPATAWGAPPADGDRLSSITYWGPESGSKQGNWEVAKYKYDAAGRLTEEWDPRLSSPLKETYTYAGEASSEAGGQLRTLTPPGQEPWSFEYKALGSEKAEAGRLYWVKRATLLGSPSTAQTTMAYGVPLSGSGAQYDLSKSAIAKWGQEDLPVDATAIFPPTEVPSSPPSGYAKASIYYMDSEGGMVNTATPVGAGTTGPAISTIEADEFGNVVRELSPQNRLRALAAGAGSVAKSHEIDTKRKYSKDGIDLQEEWGPLHLVRLESGATEPARMHSIFQYDKGWPGTGTKPHLVTLVTAGASIAGKGIDADQRITETKYDWTLRKPIETIIDPQGLKLKTVTVYDPATGLVKERRSPAAGPTGGDAHSTKIVYYNENNVAESCKKEGYAGLPCEIGPAGQPGAGLPELLVTKYKSYNSLAQPTEVVESPGGGTANARKTLVTYDTVGRRVTLQQEGGGTALSMTERLYSSSNGMPTAQRFVCGSCDSQEVVTAYDALGRPVQYTDADGNTSKTTYDLLSRPATVYDGRATQIFSYDATSGLLTRLEDPAAGTFTAAYDADGNMTEEGLPNGLVAKTTYDETDSPTALSYVKTSCAEKCTWLEESNERSIYGQILSRKSLASGESYVYDNSGRLTSTKETPTGGGCTTRLYAYDADSNRTSFTSRTPEAGGACKTSGGAETTYKYDAADRLTGEEITYDSFGRITTLPGKYAGSSPLTTNFYSNEMIASQSQGGITNNYDLDATGRVRRRVQNGGSRSTEIFHYAMASDSTAWEYNASSATWSRNITGIGGELAALQPSSGEVSLQLTNLHGDVIATASLSKTATKPTVTYEFDEFGNPKKGSAGRYGWLGGKSRRSELPSGVIQMGARSYVPSLGRFISTDPVAGGSANAYDYANQDPVNQSDLSGCSPAWIICAGLCFKTHCGGHNYAKVQQCLAKYSKISDIPKCFALLCDWIPLVKCVKHCMEGPGGPLAPDAPPGKKVEPAWEWILNHPFPILG